MSLTLYEQNLISDFGKLLKSKGLPVLVEMFSANAQPAPEPVLETPWLKYRNEPNDPFCGCGKLAFIEFRLVCGAGSWAIHKRCAGCGEPIVQGLVECASPQHEPNTVHERLERDGFEGYNDGYCGPFKWHVRGTVAWFDCPCDACAKARGE